MLDEGLGNSTNRVERARSWEKLNTVYLEETKQKFEAEHPRYALDYTHNEYTPKKYWAKKGQGIDIMAYVRLDGRVIRTFAFECKNWHNRRLTPNAYKTHVEPRFANIGDATPILITHGITNTVSRVKHLTRGIKAWLHYIIVSALPSRSIRHSTALPLFYIPCTMHSVQESNIISVCVFRKTALENEVKNRGYG